MFFYLYKITNNINGSFYVGRRQSTVAPENDDYFGSGKLLKLAIKKYGKENFTKEILEVFETETHLINAEREYVNEALTLREDCYNIAVGGHGGFTYYKDRVFNHTEETKQKISLANKGRLRPDVLQRMSIEDEAKFKKYWVGKKRSDEDKLKKQQSALKTIINGNHPSKIKVSCPHCNYKTGLGNAKRWHFENCKRKLK